MWESMNLGWVSAPSGSKTVCWGSMLRVWSAELSLSMRWWHARCRASGLGVFIRWSRWALVTAGTGEMRRSNSGTDIELPDYLRQPENVRICLACHTWSRTSLRRWWVCLRQRRWSRDMDSPDQSSWVEGNSSHRFQLCISPLPTEALPPATHAG